MFTIRAGAAEDEEFVVESEIGYFDQPLCPKDPADFVKLWSGPDSWPRREFWKAVKENRALIAVEDASDEPVGYLRYEHELEASTAYMSCIFVKRDARRKGLARRMLHVFLERAIAAGMTTSSHHVEAWNRGAIAFYETSGYTRGNEEKPGIVMFKKLC